jgi:hypothetical protein
MHGADRTPSPLGIGCGPAKLDLSRISCKISFGRDFRPPIKSNRKQITADLRIPTTYIQITRRPKLVMGGSEILAKLRVDLVYSLLPHN